MANENKPVKIVSSIPAISSDGHGIGINPESGIVNLLFIQMSPNQNPEQKELEATVVSNVRMNLEQLKQLNQALTQAIEDYESKQNEKK